MKSDIELIAAWMSAKLGIIQNYSMDNWVLTKGHYPSWQMNWPFLSNRTLTRSTHRIHPLTYHSYVICILRNTRLAKQDICRHPLCTRKGEVLHVLNSFVQLLSTLTTKSHDSSLLKIIYTGYCTQGSNWAHFCKFPHTVLVQEPKGPVHQCLQGGRGKQYTMREGDIRKGLGWQQEAERVSCNSVLVCCKSW